MADFNPPFADTGARRLPTDTERALGFPCGPASRELFNGLLWLIEANVGNIAGQAGVTPSQDGDITLLYRAVAALIDAATGGNPAGYVLMAQARARLPIFPDVSNVSGHFSVLSPSTGVVRVPAGVDFLHRGIFLVTSAQTDFNTDPSKTYHLRWNSTDGFTIKDLSSPIYNPSALQETNKAFDSVFDDMLVARIVTNSSNVATITNLANKADLSVSEILTGGDVRLPGTNGANFLVTRTLNWARTPTIASLDAVKVGVANVGGDADINVTAVGVNRNDAGAVTVAAPSVPVTRYALNAVMLFDRANSLSALFNARA